MHHPNRSRLSCEATDKLKQKSQNRMAFSQQLLTLPMKAPLSMLHRLSRPLSSMSTHHPLIKSNKESAVLFGSLTSFPAPLWSPGLEDSHLPLPSACIPTDIQSDSRVSILCKDASRSPHQPTLLNQISCAKWTTRTQRIHQWQRIRSEIGLTRSQTGPYHKMYRQKHKRNKYNKKFI